MTRLTGVVDDAVVKDPASVAGKGLSAAVYLLVDILLQFGEIVRVHHVIRIVRELQWVHGTHERLRLEGKT